MQRRPILAIYLCLTLLSTVASTTGQQARSLSEKSFLQARQVLEAGLKALGGLEALQALNDATRELSGVRTEEGQGLQPIPHQSDYYHIDGAPTVNHPKITSVRDLRGQRALDDLEFILLGGQPLKLRIILAGNTTFSANLVTRVLTVNTIPPANLPLVKANRFRRYPESLLQMAWNRPETLRWIGDSEYEGRKQQAIAFADLDGQALTLFFDAQTHLLTKTETTGDDAVLGDITFETIYTDYRPVGKLTLPFRYVDKVGGMLRQDLRAASIKLDTHPAESLFAAPQGFLNPETPPASPIVKLGNDIYAVLGSYNSMFVVFNDYVLVIEAGGDGRNSDAILAEARKAAPNKPIRYLIVTHFHFDHLGGVRNFIAEGTTIVTTPGAKGVIEQAASRAHVMKPDALSRNPRPPVIETFTDRRVFDDGAHTVELYQFSSPHCGEMIIAYLPKEKVLFEADMLNLEIPEEGIAMSGADTADLLNRIQQLGLQVERIVPVHGRLGTIEDLRRAVAKRPESSGGRF